MTVTEGGTANFTVSLSAASTQTVTVAASTANGSAVAPGDYAARSNVTLTFNPGTTTQTFAVTTINDTTAESTETFNVNLSNPSNATIADSQGVGTINDNDTAQPSLSINNVTVTESSTANFTVSLSAASTTTVTVAASTANGTAVAPGDYTARSNVTLSFPVSTTTQTFAVTTINDTTAELTETFNVNLSNPSNATIADAQGVGTINDNDAAQTSLSINDVTVTEGGTANFTVSLSAASTSTVTVAASTANGTAVAPGDYTARSNVTLTFAPNTTTQTFAVTTINDTTAESTETFNVNLSNPSNATIADAQGVGTITDNDGGAPNTSINSTSQNSVNAVTTVVPVQSQVANTSYSVLAINDLGMHCGDLDTRIASILPPFQVLLAQVVQKGTTPTLNPAGVSLYYSAAANANDPILGLSGVLNGVRDDGSTYKTNFWNVIPAGTYDPFYPAYNPLVGPSATLTPLAGPPFNVTRTRAAGAEHGEVLHRQ